VSGDPGETPRGNRGERASPTETDSAREFARLRGLLVGREQQDIADLRREIRDVALTPDNVGKHLPEAIALRAGQDDQLARALAPTLEGAFTESVHRNPEQIAQAIYPTLGPAIRKAIAEAIGGIVQGINRALEESLSVRGLKWRIEAWRSGVPYAQVVMKHALVYRVEQVYLIHAETGLLLAHVAAPDLAAPDADLISGMLTAIRDFVGDAFRSGDRGALHQFKVSDVTVIVEAGPRALIAAVVRGQHPPSLLERLQQTVELVHFQFAQPLTRFAGDSAPFAGARPLLAKCLETVVDTARKTHRGLVARLAWAGATIVVLLAAIYAVQSYRRWTSAIDTLRAEPGLVVLDADRGIRGWRVSGLRDPLARPAAVIFAELGVDTSRVRGAWAPYVSADRGIVERRITRALAAPVTARLDLRGDTLVLSGAGPADWVEHASATARGIPGISVVRDDELRIMLPVSAQPFADSIAETHIFFEVGSSRLSDVARRTLTAMGGALRAIEASLGPAWRAQLDVVGRTDTTGTEQLNQALSGDRARVATDFLMQSGIRTTLPEPRGIGTTNPLPAADLQERARLNRSVSFAIRLRRAQPGDGRIP
jgi:outer membrane protein OmpA-like peptidoglycan-associated protein